MTHRTEAQTLLKRTPKSSTDAIKLLREIQYIYDSIHEDTKKKVQPHYDAIKKIHDEQTHNSAGLWEKRRETREQLVTLIENEFVNKKTPSKGGKP